MRLDRSAPGLSLDAALKRIEKNVTGVQEDGANPADLDRMRGGPKL
jgi:hypothetical protein